MQLNRIITLIALMQCCSLTFAQSPSDLPANAGPFNLRANQMAVFNERLAGSISPLLFDSLTKGDITFDKKQRYENVLLNYDAMEDNVVAKMDALGKIVVIRKESVSDFVLFTPNGVQLAFERKSINSVPAFLLKTALPDHFLRITKRIIKPESEGAYAVNSPETTQMQCELYREYNGVLVKSLLNKRAVLKNFPALQDYIESYLKRTKTSFDNYDDVLALYEAIASVKK